MTDIQELVEEFHIKFKAAIDQPPSADLRIVRAYLLWEEFTEFLHHSGVVMTYVPDTEEVNFTALPDSQFNRVEVADALGDIAYVTYGAAVSYGIPLDDVIEEIHGSNMSKLGPDGEPIYSDGSNGIPPGKVLKGPDYFRPNLAPIVGE